MSLIHPTAIISDETKLGENVKVGPYAVIEGDVTIGAGTVVGHHASIGCPSGTTTIGKNNNLLPFCVVGDIPQDLSYKNENTKLTLGDGNTIREFVTINIGTLKDKGETIIGSGNLLMAYCHIAHDCIIGSNNVIANCVQFGGHVTVEDNVVISGGCLINQFSKIGWGSYIAGDSSVNKDILPFSMAQGKYAVIRACNKVGLKRAGFSEEDIEDVYKAIRIFIKGKGTQAESIERIRQTCRDTKYVNQLVEFVESSERGIAF